MSSSEPPAGVPGRESELFRLGVAWGTATRGRPGLIVLTGAPGSGKTALVEALAGLAGRTGGAVLRVTAGAQASVDQRAEPHDQAGPAVLLVADDLDTAGSAAAQRVHDQLSAARRAGAAFLAVVTAQAAGSAELLAILGAPTARIDLPPPRATVSR